MRSGESRDERDGSLARLALSREQSELKLHPQNRDRTWNGPKMSGRLRGIVRRLDSEPRGFVAFSPSTEVEDMIAHASIHGGYRRLGPTAQIRQSRADDHDFLAFTRISVLFFFLCFPSQQNKQYMTRGLDD